MYFENMFNVLWSLFRMLYDGGNVLFNFFLVPIGEAIDTYIIPLYTQNDNVLNQTMEWIFERISGALDVLGIYDIPLVALLLGVHVVLVVLFWLVNTILRMLLEIIPF